MSSSRNSTATSQATTDNRVASDNGAIGISGGGDVSVHMVADEAFDMSAEALADMRDLATSVIAAGSDLSGDMRFLASDAMDNSADLAGSMVYDMRGLASDAMDNSASLVGDITSLAGDAMDSTAGAVSDIKWLASDAMDNSTSLVGEISALAGDAMDQSGRAMDFVGNTLAQSMSRQLDALKSEEGQISSQLIKIGIPAAALAFVVASIMR